MKRIAILLVFGVCVADAQVVPVTPTKKTTDDTVRVAGKNWGFLGKFLTFPDGSKFTTATNFYPFPNIADTSKYIENGQASASLGKLTLDSAAYGDAFIDEDIGYDSIIVSDAAVWYTIGAVQPPNGYKLTAGDTLKNVTAQDSSMTVGVNGVYEVSYAGNGRVTGISAASNLHTHVFVNDVMKTHTGSDGNISASNAFFSLGISPVKLVLKKNDIVKVKIMSPDDASGTLIFHHFTFGVTRIQQ